MSDDVIEAEPVQVVHFEHPVEDAEPAIAEQHEPAEPNYQERAEAAEARADELARALFTARVQATGKLADATDLAYDPDLLDDPDKLSEAIDELLKSKPHFRRRTITGNVGLGVEDRPKTAGFAGLFAR